MLFKAKQENKAAVFSIHFRFPAVKLMWSRGSCEQAEWEADDVRAQDGCLVSSFSWEAHLLTLSQQLLSQPPSNSSPVLPSHSNWSKASIL